jgi:hypothetical protein
MKAGYPAWIPFVLYGIVCCLFQNSIQNLIGLLCALALFLAATTIGRVSGAVFQTQNRTLDFPFGLGILLLVVYAIGSWNASETTIKILWVAIGICSISSIKELNRPIPWYTLYGAPFLAVATWSTFTPTTFYDALAYNLGIPYQYSAYDQMKVFPTWTTSYFPPFDQITKFLLISIAPQNAVKLFSLFLYLHALRMLTNVQSEDLKSKYVVIPLLLLPVPWILAHIVNPDLLVTSFFVAAACGMLSARNLKDAAFASVLLAFACWTKYTIYPYLFFVPVLLWFRGIPPGQYIRRLFVVGIVFLLVMSPLYIRNAILESDPLYPVGASFFPSDWTPKQTAAVQNEFPTPKNWTEYIKSVVLTPIRATFQLRSYGSASEVGFLPLIALILLPIHYTKLKNRISLFVLFCYLAWVYQLYHFRYFLPVYLVASLLLAYSFQRIGTSFPKMMPPLWIAAAIWGLWISIPVYRFFPLISPAETPESYLSRELSYFDAAQFLNRLHPKSSTIMVGETRTAYFRVPLIPFSYTDPDPLLRWAMESRNSQELYSKLKNENAGHIVYNQKELSRLAKQYGIWLASPEENEKVKELLQMYGRIVFSKNGVVVIQIK